MIRLSHHPRVTEPTDEQSDFKKPEQDSTRFNVIRSIGREFKESDHKGRMGLAGAQLLVGQALDRLRVVVWVVPPAVVSTMEHTNNSLVAGAVGAGLFAMWGVGLGESTLQGVDAFPETVKTFEQEHPNVVNLFADVLPGVVTGGPSNASGNPTTLELVGTHLRRGPSSVSIGTSPYVSTAKAVGYSNTETRKLYAETSADGAGFVFCLAVGMTEGIKRLALAGHYELAQNMQNIVSDDKTWYGVAGTLMAVELILNKVKSRKEKRLNSADNTSIENSVD